MRALLALTLTLLLAALSALAFQGWRGRDAQGRLQRQLALATEENSRLRSLVQGQEKQRRFERTAAVRREIEQEVEELRGLKFKQPVAYASVSRREIKEVFSKALAEEYTEQEFADLGRAWYRLGLLPQPIALRQTLLDLLSEQVAAFYNQHEHKLYMFEDATLESSNDRMILAHELTHALQDQHFGIRNLPLELKNNDDRALAALSLLEGDATEVMMQYMARHVSMKTVLEGATSVLSTQMEQLQKVPKFLRDRLTFPYLAGKGFVASAASGDEISALPYQNAAATDGMNGLYQRVPSSTTQILHPEMYAMVPPEEPVAIAWPAVDFQGQKPTQDNVVGEAGVKALFVEWADAATAKTASEGWRGDRYLSFAQGDALVWKSVWSDEANAREFFDAQRKSLTKRYGAETPAGTAERCEFQGARAVRLWLKPGENSVTVVDADAAPLASKLEEQFAR